MNKDLISIIVPIYNVEQYLNRCIESLVNQTYTNLEILLIDDGSTDNSGTLAEKWISNDQRIKVYHKKNGGLSDARNYGIKYAKGKYLSFVDSDDYVDMRFIEILYKTCIETNTKIATIGIQMFSDDVPVEKCVRLADSIDIYIKEQAIKYLYAENKYGNYAWNKLYLKELFNNIKYPYGRKMEDLGTTYLLFDKCDYISYNSSKLYFYYQRSDSILHSLDSKFWVDKFTLITERYNYIKKKYPNIEENYIDYMNGVLDAYPYISEDERKISRNEAIKIWSKVKRFYGIKMKIKYYLFKFIPKLYVRVLKKC